MFQEKKKTISPFGGDEGSAEEIKVIGEKKKPVAKKPNVKEMVAESRAKRKKSARDTCGCW